MGSMGSTHRTIVAALMAVVAIAAPTRAATCPPQPPTLLRDTDLRPGSQRPRHLVAVGTTLFFTAMTPAEGEELWSSDGTPGGTIMVADINPGRGDSAPAELTAVGGRLFFSADDGTNGRELWTSDGTPGGTTLVEDIDPGPGTSSPLCLTD